MLKPEASPEPDWKMAEILIVDDDAGFRGLLRTALEAAGHEVREAGDGSAALLLCAQRSDDLIIMDLIMDGKEGIETILDLRRRKTPAKIIAISGTVAHLEMAHLVGADQILAKPFSHQELLSLINTTLGT